MDWGAFSEDVGNDGGDLVERPLALVERPLVAKPLLKIASIVVRGDSDQKLPNGLNMVSQVLLVTDCSNIGALRTYCIPFKRWLMHPM